MPNLYSRVLLLIIFYPVVNALLYGLVKSLLGPSIELPELFGFSSTTLLLLIYIELTALITIIGGGYQLVPTNPNVVNRLVVFCMVPILFYFAYLVSSPGFDPQNKYYGLGDKLHLYFIVIVIPAIVISILFSISGGDYDKFTIGRVQSILIIIISIAVLYSSQLEFRLSLDKLNPNSVATYSGLLLIILISNILNTNEDSSAIVYRFALLLCVSIIVLRTSSIAITLALIIGVVIEVLLKRLLKRKLFLLASILFILLAIFVRSPQTKFSNHNDVEQATIYTTTEINIFDRGLGSILNEHSTLYDRLTVYKMAWNKLLDMEIFGGGYDVGGIISPHNIFLESFFVGGILFTLFFAAYYINLFVRYVNYPSNEKFSASGASLIFCFLISLQGGQFLTCIPLIVFSVLVDSKITLNGKFAS